MARRTITQRLEHLGAQKRALQARLGKQERARDTRRKILLGALVLQRMATSHDTDQVAWLRTWLINELPSFLTRDGDKELLADLLTVDLPLSEQNQLANTNAELERPVGIPEPA